MKQSDQITIIIPVYNVANYLCRCIESIINQTYQNLEIICIDDGSTDDSGKLLDRYAKIDERIIVLHTENQGVSAARNTAISRATGKFLMFVDGDDWIELDSCEIAMRYMEKQPVDLLMWSYLREYEGHSTPKIVYPTEQYFDADGCRHLQRRMIGLTGKELARPENADALSTVWGKLYRCDIITDHDIRFVDLKTIGTYEDGLFNLHYDSYIENARYIPEYLYHYRKNTGMTSKFRRELGRQWKRLFLEMRRYIDKNHCDAEFNDALNNRISLSIIGLGLNALACPNQAAFAEVRNVLGDAEYRTAIRTLSMRYFPLHWWVFFACCKMNFAIGVYLLLKCMEGIKG